MSAYKIEAGTGQHIGDRAEQQDRVALFGAPRAPGYMMAILADGMGGARGGSIAAEQAIRTAQQIFENFSPLTDDVDAMLHQIADELHTVIRLLTLSSQIRPQTTLAMLVLTPERSAVWGHVGDSRIYRFSGPNLAERTDDSHRAGKGTGQHAGNVAPTGATEPAGVSNLIGKAGPPPVLTLGRHAGLKAGDAFVLCSDGVWLHCSEGELGAAVAMHSPRDAAQMLLRKARERVNNGDGDNCSLAVIKLQAAPTPIPEFQVDSMRRAV